MQHGKPSLVCDFMEIYRYLTDDFLIDYCRELSSKDFEVKIERIGRKKQGKREYLTDIKSKLMLNRFQNYFKSTVEIARIKNAEKQTIDTLLSRKCYYFHDIYGEKKVNGTLDKFP